MNIKKSNKPLDHWKRAGFIATLVLMLSFPAYLIRHAIWIKHHDAANRERVATYTGGDQCIDCHLKEYNEWKGSDHDNAMDVARPESVRGNFNHAVFKALDGTVSRFYTRDHKYYVETPGPGGKVKEFNITHTFGVKPLQQYLIPFESGRLQCLPIAWDTERKTWFSLADSMYRNENLSPGNWLYWTNNGQNWNGMCADCHSTNLQKGYDPVKHTFHTTWSDIDVNCEACHGPGSKHIEWANLPVMTRPEGDYGLVVQTGNISSQEVVSQCARCHSRRSVQGDFDPLSYHRDMLNYMIPQLPVEPVYFPDGQILDEDYVYASFTQSYMYYQDVSCKDCHNVHSLAFVKPVEDNQLCLQCHRAEEYDTYRHYFHKKTGEPGKSLHLKKPWQGKTTVNVGEGALCINCHMPGRYYMGVDFRRDHSFRVPRPDLSIKFGTPNACNECHTDRNPSWANNYINQWYGKNRKHHFSEVFLAATEQDTGAKTDLISLTTNELYPVTVRAAAVYLLQNFPGPESTDAIRQALSDPESLIRLTAVDILPATDADRFIRDLGPVLQDPVKAVRARAAFRLSPLKKQLQSDKLSDRFNKALDEYRTSMEYMGDFPSSRHNLGVVYGNTGNMNAAISNYKEALRIDNLFYPAKINLALLYNQQGRNDEAEKLLREVLALHPEQGETYYYLGLLLAEKKDYRQSLVFLNQAAHKMPGNTRIYYNLALLYQQLLMPEKAEQNLKECLSVEPENYDYLYAAAVFYLNQRDYEKARQLATKMKKLYPQYPAADNLLKALQEK
ncbi:MAG: tetratricopeptide repeat protein [Chlorobi bacterium]|nr:tetratricopeptide repeat protein [Chlorobiota bacterium]